MPYGPSFFLSDLSILEKSYVKSSGSAQGFIHALEAPTYELGSREAI